MRIQYLNDMTGPFNEPLHQAQLVHDCTDLLSPSLISNDLISPVLPTCISIMQAKDGKDFGMFSFLINTISVITKFL